MLKWILILSYLGNELFEGVIEYLNSTHLKTELPENVRDVYDEEEYRKWISYEKDYGRIYVIEKAVNVIIMLLLFVCNIHARLFELLSGMNLYVQYLLVILIFTIISEIISLPFEYHKTFVIEERYGMNKTTHRTFVMDILKSVILGVVLSFIIMAIILFLFENYGNAAIYMTMAALTVLILLISVLTIPLMRLFNKFSPLEDGELKDRILSLCDKYGIRVKKILVRDASRRTTKSNAFCTGFRQKTISLDDNLVQSFDTEEIVAVFAHEFAHAKYRHTLKSLPLAIISLILIVGAMGVVLNIPAMFTAFGFDGINYYFAQVLLTPVIWPLRVIIDIVSSGFSRRHEYQADAFSAREGYGEALIHALKKLSKESLSDINPHPVKVFLAYSHPTLSQRIDAIRKIEGLK